MHILFHRQMIRRRPQVLAEGEDVRPGIPQIAHGLCHLRLLFPQAQHQAGFSQHPGGGLLGVFQHIQSAPVTGAGVPHPAGEPLDGLQVLGENFHPGARHRRRRRQVAAEIRGQGFHRGGGVARADGRHACGVMPGAAVREVVPVHRGEHHIAQAHRRHRPGRVGRLSGIQPAAGVAGIHRAEAACAGADRTHQH